MPKRLNHKLSTKLPTPESPLEAEFALQIRSFDLERFGVKREYRFHVERKWRFDFAFPEHDLAIEIEGGVWSGGRHTRGQGFIDDCEKYNTAALHGWRVLRFTEKHLNDLSAITLVSEVLTGGDGIHTGDHTKRGARGANLGALVEPANNQVDHG